MTDAEYRAQLAGAEFYDAEHPAPRSVPGDPVEKVIFDALVAAEIEFVTELDPRARWLDFYLPGFDLHIEVKQFHSPRSGAQIERSNNVILVVGMEAARTLASFITATKRDPKKWTDQEIHFLVKNRSVLTSAEIGEELGRTTDAVSNKIKSLKDVPRLVTEWTEEQDDFLRGMYSHFDAPTLGEMTGRSQAAVLVRAGKLQLTGKSKSTLAQFRIWRAMRSGQWLGASEIASEAIVSRRYAAKKCDDWMESGAVETRRTERISGRGYPYIREYRRTERSELFPPI